ncbi:hypothetical protein DAERI_040171 [Deinococcus aerius]|uniref:Uncharacterized protein n=1 Tax=Deinococcus aerius TaxID=200253 RepID=A0A2I9DKK1_9DEIO|nr:hypothetical protein [Deinococcus aerius]GBF05411.1 hypothetical protein DAERI_040171 [Deinococcus aerius]
MAGILVSLLNAGVGVALAWTVVASGGETRPDALGLAFAFLYMLGFVAAVVGTTMAWKDRQTSGGHTGFLSAPGATWIALGFGLSGNLVVIPVILLFLGWKFYRHRQLR